MWILEVIISFVIECHNENPDLSGSGSAALGTRRKVAAHGVYQSSGLFGARDGPAPVSEHVGRIDRAFLDQARHPLSRPGGFAFSPNFAVLRAIYKFALFRDFLIFDTFEMHALIQGLKNKTSWGP